MRIFRPPYTVEEIEATPYEFGGPFLQTRRGKMWQARIDYWERLAHIAQALTIVFALISVVFFVIAATH